MKRLCVETLFVAVFALGWAGMSFSQTTPEAPAAPRFEIQRFIIEGNTLLPAAQAEALVAPFAGKNRDFGDVQRALEALQEAYVDLGYSAVRVLVPEQDLVSGQVKLQVVEARIQSVRIEGNKFFETANIRASVAGIKEGESPNTTRLGESVQLANENPAKQVRIVLEAPDDPSKIDAVVRVTDYDPVRHSVYLDDTGNTTSGRYRAGYGFQHANMFGRDQVLNAQFVTSPTNISDVAIYGVGYRVPFYAWNSIFDVYAGYSDVDSGTVQNLFTVTGAGTVFGMRYTQMLPRLGAFEQRVALGWDYRDIRNNVGSVIAPGSTLVPDVTYRPFSLSYTGRMSQVGRDLSFFAAYSWNLPGGADGDQTAFEATRPGANPHYSILRYGGAFTQALPADLMLRAVLNGQYTSNALIPAEQFGMGGMDNVRGFFEREVSADTGHRMTLEAYSPDLGANIGADWKARMVFFTDFARGRDNDPPRDSFQVKQGLASIGLGFRANMGRALSLRFDWATVTNSAGSRPEGQDRVHFSLGYGF